MEIVHCHIAQQPEPEHKANPSIQEVLSTITGKLLSKAAEDRYQSAYGLKSDLEIALKQYRATGRVQSFEIGQSEGTRYSHPVYRQWTWRIKGFSLDIRIGFLLRQNNCPLTIG